MSDRYEIVGKLTRGGIGAIYKARDTVLNRSVALKRLLPIEETRLNDASDTEALKREALALARFQHPNVLTVFGIEEDSEGPFVVLELLEGETLKELVAQGVFEPSDFDQFVLQTLDPLIAANELNLLHRDLKPANIMFSWLPTGSFQVKLLDFGLAKFSEKPSTQTLDQTGSFLGSIDYIAPEQIELGKLDQRTDLYSLGCVYYFALTQKPPFEGESTAATMKNHLSHSVIPLSELRSDLPGTTADWVMKLISRSKSDRPANAAEALRLYIEARDTPLTASLPVAIPVVEEEKTIPMAIPVHPEASTRPESPQTFVANQTKTVQTGPSSSSAQISLHPGRPPLPVRKGLGLPIIGLIVAACLAVGTIILLFNFGRSPTQRDSGKVSASTKNSKSANTNKGNSSSTPGSGQGFRGGVDPDRIPRFGPASIKWSPVFELKSPEDIRVPSNAELSYAIDFNPPNLKQKDDTKINGIPFEKRGYNRLPNNFTNGPRFHRNEHFKGDLGDQDLNILLAGSIWKGGKNVATLTLKSLKIGERYQVQIIAGSDERPNSKNIQFDIDDGIGNYGSHIMRRGSRHTVVGEFTAKSDLQTIHFRPRNGDVSLSGLVVFRLK